MKAWCITGNTIKNAKDSEYGTYNEFWIGIYDKDDKIKITFESYGGMCDYKFEEFFDLKGISCKIDLEIQELFIKKINELIDQKIIKIKKNRRRSIVNK